MAQYGLGDFFEWLGHLFDKNQGNTAGSMDTKTGGWYPGKIWNDITGLSNTIAQNSASAAFQEDAQEHQKDMLAAQNQASLDLATKMPAATMAGLKAAGLNPAMAAGDTFSGSVSSSSAGIANAQVSNVSALQSAANTAVIAGMLVKLLKTVAK